MSQSRVRVKLSDAELEKLSCPEGKKDALFFDMAERGFGVRVTADGKRVLLFQYRMGSVVRRYRIGVWGQGALTTSKARKIAEKLRGQVHEGQDPAADRKAENLAKAASALAERQAAAVEAFTFGKLIDQWEAKGLAHRRPSYVADATARLRTYFAAWKDKPAGSITKAEAIAVLDRVEKDRGTTSSRRALAYGRAAYGWAEKRDLVEGNPFRGVAALGQENTRERVLTAEELRGIWAALVTMDSPAGAYMRVLLLTLQRREEVAGMRWDELAADRSTWTVPAARAKNGRAHLVHLTEPVRASLAKLPRMAGNPHVFAGRGNGHIGGFSRMKEELLQVMAGEAPVTPGKRRAKAKAAIPVDWRFHDFRRSGVTALAGLGFAPHVCDRLLNHVTGAIQGVAAVYQRAEFLAERKAALETWAEFVTTTCHGRDKHQVS